MIVSLHVEDYVDPLSKIGGIGCTRQANGSPLITEAVDGDLRAHDFFG